MRKSLFLLLSYPKDSENHKISELRPKNTRKCLTLEHFASTLCLQDSQATRFLYLVGRP